MFGLMALPRITTVPSDLTTLDADLAKQAAATLGYSAMGSEIRAKQIKRDFYGKLIAMGVPPINERAVERYQIVMHLRKWLSPFVAQLGVIAFVVATFYLRYDLFHADANGGWTILADISTLLGGLIASGVVWVIAEPRNWEWTEHALNGYSRPIPAHVLATALLIKHEIPDVRFFVEDFQLRQRVADPFLIAFIDGASAYVAVWDEPTFAVSRHGD